MSYADVAEEETNSFAQALIEARNKVNHSNAVMPDFPTMMYRLSAIFETNLTKHKIAMYQLVLRDLDFNELVAAAFEHMKNGRSFPYPADLRELVMKARSQSADGASG